MACFYFCYVTQGQNQVIAKGCLSYFIQICLLFILQKQDKNLQALHLSFAKWLSHLRVSLGCYIFLTECLKHLIIVFGPSEDMESVLISEGLKKDVTILPSGEKISLRNSKSTPCKIHFSDTTSAGCL